jgi:glycosyltransferase involved in cell wall biosynthesis
MTGSASSRPTPRRKRCPGCASCTPDKRAFGEPSIGPIPTSITNAGQGRRQARWPWSKRRRRPFIFATASDANAGSARRTSGRRGNGSCRFGLQALGCGPEATEALFRGFGVQAEVIRSCSRDPLAEAPLPPRATTGPGLARVLWVGRFHPKKRFELLLEIAAACPRLPFDVVGGRAGDSAYASSLVEPAKRLPNVTLHGWVPPDEIRPSTGATASCAPPSSFPSTFLKRGARRAGLTVDGCLVAGGLRGSGRQPPDLAAACPLRLLRNGQVFEASAGYYLPAPGRRGGRRLRRLLRPPQRTRDQRTHITQATGTLPLPAALTTMLDTRPDQAFEAVHTAEHRSGSQSDV